MIHLFPGLLEDDLFLSSVKFEVPFYITQGAHDYMVSQVLAEKYAEACEAPKRSLFYLRIRLILRIWKNRKSLLRLCAE